MTRDHPCVGKVGKCSRGRIGLITGRREMPWGQSWVGIGLDDGTEWASRTPEILTIPEIERLRGKKCVKPAA